MSFVERVVGVRLAVTRRRLAFRHAATVSKDLVADAGRARHLAIQRTTRLPEAIAQLERVDAALGVSTTSNFVLQVAVARLQLGLFTTRRGERRPAPSLR